MALGLPIAACLAFFGRGHVFHLVGVALLCSWVGGPLALLGLALFAGGRLGNADRVAETGVVALGAAAIFAVQLLSLPVGSALADRDIREAQTFCEGLVPRLDALKMATGTYPLDVRPVLPADEELPRLLARKSFYSSDGKAFFFEFRDPGSFGLYEYSSSGKAWLRD